MYWLPPGGVEPAKAATVFSVLATPLVTMRAVYARVDFWALLVGDLRLHEVRVTGVDLREPAMLSPSGADEAVVSDLDGVFLLHGSDYVIAPCTFRVAGVTVTGEGGFHLPKTIRARPGSMPMLDLVLLRYLQAGRRLIALRSRLDGLEEPHLPAPRPNPLGRSRRPGGSRAVRQRLPPSCTLRCDRG